MQDLESTIELLTTTRTETKIIFRMYIKCIRICIKQNSTGFCVEHFMKF